MEHIIEDLERKSDRLEREVSLLKGWISLLSHDSKQIFGNIKWLIEAYEDETIALDDLIKMLPQIKRDAIKNFQVAQDTSVYLKTQYGNFKPKEDVMNGYSLYTSYKNHFSEELKSKEVLLEFEGDERLSILADEVLLRFCLEKVINNAIKFSLQFGKIIFRVSLDESNYYISIIDNGTGIKENNLKTIFSFESAIFEGTKGEIGAGLSLKIVQSFVNLMDGILEINSDPTQGTLVTIKLPHIQK